MYSTDHLIFEHRKNFEFYKKELVNIINIHLISKSQNQISGEDFIKLTNRLLISDNLNFCGQIQCFLVWKCCKKTYYVPWQVPQNVPSEKDHKQLQQLSS